MRLAVIPVCLTLAAPAAFAQAFDAVRLSGAIGDTDRGEFGLALISTTEYTGSDERRVMVFPALD